MVRFNIVITEKCNAKCTHCYMGEESKKKKKTLTEEEINNFLKNIPKSTKLIVLTGGEIYLEKDFLHKIIEKIYTKNIEIGLESNGIYFYQDLERAKKELETLKKMGVSFIRFSDDPFHKEGGVDLEKVRKLKLLESEETPTIKFLEQEKALAIGRAKTLPKEKLSKPNCMNSKDTELNPYLFVDISGEVYPCAWKMTPSLGNIFKDSYDKIEKNLKKDRNRQILIGEIEEAVSLKTKKNIEEIKKESKKNGQCSLCIKVFNKGVEENE